MKLIRRAISETLITASENFPVVTILGPRQSGKTTLVKNIFPGYTYVNLEDPETYSIAMEDVNAFFSMYKTPMIIDEVQRAPQILSKIQVIVDEVGKNGMFILTGSFQQALKLSVSQSLAGRTALLNLLPLSITELAEAGTDCTRDEYIYNGFMPRHYANNQPVNMLYSAYFQTYVEKDVQTLLGIRKKSNFDKFIKLLAGRVGQVVNLDSLSNDTGVSSETIASWLSVLESSFVIFRVEPFYENYTKRLVKSPKIYFSDTGLLCYLLGIRKADQVSRDPLLGKLFENLVVLEILKAQYSRGEEKNLYFFRDSKGFEIDCIIPAREGFVPVEIKSAMTFNGDFANKLRRMEKITDKAFNPTVIYSGNAEGNFQGAHFVNFKKTAGFLRQMAE